MTPDETPSEPVIDSQPVEAEAASAVAEDASLPAEEAPAEPVDETPVAEAEAGPALSDEDVDWFLENDPRFADKAKERVRPEVAEEVKRELTSTPERAKRVDPFFQAIQQQNNEAQGRIGKVIEKFVQGEFPDDPHAFLADLATQSVWEAASERRGHIDVNRAVLERQLGIDNGVVDEKNPVQKEYADLIVDLEEAQQNAYRIRRQAVTEYDPNKRAQLITRSETMDATAVGDFYNRSLKLAYAQGKVDGVTDNEKRVAKRIDQTAEKARTNGHTEAVAKAAALRQAQIAGATAGLRGEPPAPSELTREAAESLPISELKRLRGVK